MITTPQKTLSLALLGASMLATPVPAQNDDLLVVEKRKDLAARTRIVNHLRKIVVTVDFKDSTAREFTDYLQHASGKAVNFIVSTKTQKVEDMPKVTLSLKSVNLANLMSVYEDQTGLKFSFNSGMVFLKPKDEVKAFAYLQMYDVRAAVFKATVFVAPKLGLRPLDGEGGFVGGTEEEPQPINGYDIDQLVDLVKSNAVTESWDTEGISIDGLAGVLLVRQTVKGHKEVKDMLTKLGAIPAKRRVVVSRRPPPLRKSQKAKKTPKSAKPAPRSKK